MGFTKKTIRNVDIPGKRVLVRVDYSVEVEKDGTIHDDFKLRASLPTIRYALEQGAAVVLCSHMGRPGGTVKTDLSLFPIAKHLKALLGQPVEFVPEVVGERAKKAVASMKPGDVILLENLRFDPREESNDDQFATELAELGDVFVQDGFAVAYRRHASVDAITKHLPSVAGLLLEKELVALTNVFAEDTRRPLVVIVGGASLAEKASLLERAIQVADAVAVGGPLGTVFMHEMGIPTGKSGIDEADKPLARELLDRARAAHQTRGMSFIVPQDAVVAEQGNAQAQTRIVDWSAHIIADIEAYPRRSTKESGTVQATEQVLDIGPFSGAYLAGLTEFAGTVLWCGVMGEVSVRGHQGPVGPFAHGSELLTEALTGQLGRIPTNTIVAGDDAVHYAISRGIERGFDHLSSGGGASLEVLAGHSLIGVDVLEDK